MTRMLLRPIITGLAWSLAIICTVGLITPTSANTEQNEASANALLKDVLDYVTEWVNQTMGAGSRLELASEASVQPRGYKVQMLFPNPAILGTAGNGLRMNDITATVVPENNNEFAFSISLPYGAEGLGAGGEPEAELTWTDSNLSGIWRADLETPTVLNGILYDFRVTDLEQISEPAVLRLDSLKVDQDLNEAANGLWKGSMSLVMKNLNLAPPKDEISVFLKEFSMQSTVNGLDLISWLALSEWVNSIAPMVKADEFAPPLDISEAIHIFEKLNIGAGDSSLTIYDMHSAQESDRLFNVNELALGFEYDNNRRPGGYSVTVAWHELDIANLAMGPSEFFPHTGSLKLDLERFPARQISLAMIDLAGDSDNTAVLDSNQALQLFVPPLFHANRTTINIEELILESSAASIRVAGKLTAEAQSATGAIGEARVEVAGLDKLMAIAAREALQNESTRSTLAFLAIAKGFGRPEIASDNKLVYVFDVLLPTNGKITINEIPLDLIMNSGTAQLEERVGPLS